MKILKYIIISFVSIFIIVVSFIFILSKSMNIEWGNTVDFENKMDIPIDSLEISVCNTKTIFKTTLTLEGIEDIGGNMNTPENGYPCPVEIIVYSLGKKIKIKSDKNFDCNNCDIYHRYTVTKKEAFYSYY